VDDAAMEIIKPQLVLFRELGITKAVLHVNGGLKLPEEERYAKWMKYLGELSDFVDGTGITLCLENLNSNPQVRSADGLLQVIRDAGDKNFGICLDTGHLHLSNKEGHIVQTQGEFIRKAGHYLQALHIQDNNGLGDVHQMPYSARYGIDWQDVMTQTSTRQKYNVSISGGSENVRSNFSIGYTDNKGIIVNTWNKRLTLRLNTDFNITKWLKAGINLSFSTGKNSGGGNMINYARVVPTMDYVDNATGKLVNVPVQYEDGTFGHFTFDDDVNFTAGKYASNPYADKMYRSYKKDWDNDNGSVRNSFYAEVTLMKGLVFRTNLNYDFYGNNSWSYSPAYIDTQYTYDQLNGEDPVDQFSVSGSASTSVLSAAIPRVPRNFASALKTKRITAATTR
jgi:roadblock/LC7 domain-containing protein